MGDPSVAPLGSATVYPSKVVIDYGIADVCDRVIAE
jgi:hypothetical protein